MPFTLRAALAQLFVVLAVFFAWQAPAGAARSEPVVPVAPIAKAGVLDLNSWDFKRNGLDDGIQRPGRT